MTMGEAINEARNSESYSRPVSENRSRIMSLEKELIKQGNRLTAIEVEMQNQKETIDDIKDEFKSQRTITRTTLITTLLTLATIFAKFVLGKI